MQNNIPRTADLHQMLRLPRNMRLSRCPTPATEFAHWHHLTQPWQPDIAICKKHATLQHDTSNVLHLPRKMTMEVSKAPRLPQKMQLIFWQRRKSIAPVTHKTILDTLWNSLTCPQVPRLPRKMTLQSLLNLRKWKVLQHPPRHSDVTSKPENRDETCWSLKILKTSISCEKWI